jgi:hypothetical protein
MTQADRVLSTPRRTAPKNQRLPAKKSPKTGETKTAGLVPNRSEIIEQSMIYVQCRAAHDVAFTVDGTGDSEYVGEINLKKSNRAIVRLVALCSHKAPGAPPLTTLELYAKAKVLEAIYGLQKDAEPNEIELAYIRFFAGEVSDYLIAGGEVKL